MKRLLNIVKNPLLIDLILIFILSLIPLLWFREKAIMFGHDNVFPLDPQTFLNGRLFTWIDHSFGYSQAIIMGTIPIHFIDALPSFLGFNLQLTQKIVYIFWFFMMGISVYILASIINKESRIFKLTCVVIYTINFFILQGWWIGERTKFSAYVAFPLIIAVYLYVYKNKLSIVRGAIFNSFILFIFNGGGIYGTPLFGGFFIALLTFIVYFSILSFFKREYFVIKKLLLLFFLSFIGFLLINSYYLFPTASKIFSQYNTSLNKVGGTSSLISWADEISANASYLNLFRLQGMPEWYDNPEHPYAQYYFNNPFLVLGSFVWPFLVFLSIALVKNKEKLEIMIYFFLVYLLGILFTAGTHPPLGFFYAYLMKVMPGFAIFRTPFFKFAPAMFFATSFLIAFFIDHFKGNLKKIIFLLLLFFVLIYHFPYFTGDFFTWREGFSTRNIPPGYLFEFGRWIENKEDEGRVLLLPPLNPDWQYDIYDWGYLSYQVLPSLVTNREILANNDKLNNRERNLLDQLYDSIERKDIKSFNQLASLLQVKYLVVRNDFQFNLNWIRENDPKFYTNIINYDFNLPLVNKFGKWELYVTKNTNSAKFFLTDKVNSLDASDKEVNKFYNFVNNNDPFVIQEDISVEILSRLDTDYHIPQCISCRFDISPNIQMHNVNILPDSPLYPLIILREKININNSDLKTAIYNDLGLSLKRLSEINSLIFKKKNADDNLLNQYVGLLNNIRNNFRKIDKFKDKYELAEDINNYVKAERNKLRGVFNPDLLDYTNVEVLDEVFEAMDKLEKETTPYLLISQNSFDRLYGFNLNSQGENIIFLKREDFLSNIKEKSRIKILIDKKIEKEITLNPQILANNWLSFGVEKMDAGEHSLLVSLPQLPNVLSAFTPEKNQINASSGGKCFSATIVNYNNKKTYKINFEFINNFSDFLYFYIIQKKGDKIQLDSLTKFEKGFDPYNYEELIRPSLANKEASINICSNNLTQEILNNNFKLSVNEVLIPSILIVPIQKKEAKITNLTYKKINPTRYIVNLKDVRENNVLVFSEEYDNQWELDKFGQNHFKINGYANAWLIDKPGDYVLTLNYKPQQFFYIGTAISILTIIIFSSYLILKKKK